VIHTTLAQLDRYAAIHPAFAQAFAALKKKVQEPFAAGRTEVDGEALFINAFSYETREASVSQMEAHRQYVDMMFVMSGKEKIAYCPLEKLTEIITPYSEDGDALLAKLPSAYDCITMEVGDVAIFFPEDAHCPGLKFSEKQQVEKMVVKVRL
jgi:biofilm protein TabA